MACVLEKPHESTDVADEETVVQSEDQHGLQAVQYILEPRLAQQRTRAQSEQNEVALLFAVCYVVCRITHGIGWRLGILKLG